MRRIAIVAVLTIVSAFLVGTGIYEYRRASAGYSCVAGADEKCPDAKFLDEFADFAKIRDKYAVPADIQKQQTIHASNLTAQIPQGYQFDETKMRFTKIPPPKQ